MQHARGTLKKIFTATLRREGGDQAPVLAWPVACGRAVAEKTKAISFAGGVLVVQVPDTAWGHQLQSLAQQYVAALNQLSAQKVEDINFVLPDRYRPTGV